MRLSQRMARLGTETAFKVLGRARALDAKGKHVIHLEIGEPDFDTPAHITDAAVRALKGGPPHCGPAGGIPELRAAVAEDTTRRRGVRATPEMVVITPGAKPIMFFVILALIDEGDEVLYPNPGFPIYESMIRYIGGNPVPVRLLEDKGFALDVDQLVSRVSPKTRLIILNYPHNPTGGTIPETGLRAIADVAVLHGDLQPDGGGGRAQGGPVGRRRHGGRVPPPARRDRRRPAGDPRLPVRAAQGRLLRVSQHHPHRTLQPDPRRHAARRGRCGLPGGHGLRRVRRGPPALLLRQQAGEHRRSPAADQGLDRVLITVFLMGPLYRG